MYKRTGFLPPLETAKKSDKKILGSGFQNTAYEAKKDSTPWKERNTSQITSLREFPDQHKEVWNSREARWICQVEGVKLTAQDTRVTRFPMQYQRAESDTQRELKLCRGSLLSIKWNMKTHSPLRKLYETQGKVFWEN